jgi:hypothetical protein
VAVVAAQLTRVSTYEKQLEGMPDVSSQLLTHPLALTLHAEAALLHAV